MTGLDWTDVEAVRAWLDKKYPNSNREIGSPFFQYLKDEKAKGHKINGRERHLSSRRGGELRKWIWEESEHSVFYYPEMKVTYYPEYADPESPSSAPKRREARPKRTTPDPILPLLENFRKYKRLKEQAEAELQEKETARQSRKRAAKALPSPAPDPNDLEHPQLRKKPSKPSNISSGKNASQHLEKRKRPNVNSSGNPIDSESSKTQRQRVSTLRPRRDRKRPQTGKST